MIETESKNGAEKFVALMCDGRALGRVGVPPAGSGVPPEPSGQPKDVLLRTARTEKFAGCRAGRAARQAGRPPYPGHAGDFTGHGWDLDLLSITPALRSELLVVWLPCVCVGLLGFGVRHWKRRAGQVRDRSPD